MIGTAAVAVPVPALAVEHEVGGRDLDGAFARDPAALVYHGHDEGVGVAVVDVVVGPRQADAVAVAHPPPPPHRSRIVVAVVGALLQRRQFQ